MKHLLFALSYLAILGAGCQMSQNSTDTARQPVQTAQERPASETELDLHGRRLTAVPMDVFSRTGLTGLNLSNNQLIDAPPSQIGRLKNLVSLDLSNNALTGLPAELGQLSKLEILNVSNNKITGLPMELENLTQLRILDVSGNPYSSQDLEKIAKKLSKTEIRR